MTDLCLKLACLLYVRVINEHSYPSYFKMHNQQTERRGYLRHDVEDLVILNQDFITLKIHSFGLPYGRRAGITA